MLSKAFLFIAFWWGKGPSLCQLDAGGSREDVGERREEVQGLPNRPGGGVPS